MRKSKINMKNKTKGVHHEEIPDEHDDPLIQFLRKTIRLTVKILAILMTLVIIWGIGDVIYVPTVIITEPRLFKKNWQRR